MRSISEAIHILAENPENPYHASLKIMIDGEYVHGIVTNAMVLDLFDQILEHLELNVL